MKPSIASSLICLSFCGFAFAETPPTASGNIEALDLEKIVIRGEAKRNPIRLGRVNPRKVNLPRTQIDVSPLPLAEKARWQNTLKLLAGNNNAWSASNSLSIKRKQHSFGALINFEDEKGFREGHGKDKNQFGFEWSRTRPNNPSYYFSTSFLQRKLDLPEPESLFYRGHIRKEKSIANNFRLETPLFKDDLFQLFLENEVSSQSDTDRSSFRSSLWRIGFLYNVGQWETALSIENDKRDIARTTISRFFVQKSSNILDKHTNLHLGLGFYSFSNKSESLRNSGFLALIEEDKFKNGVALSPFAQLDHNVTDKLAFYIAYTQVYETSPFVETYFDNPILSQPNDFIQPSLNIQIDTGLRLRIFKNWQTSLSYSLNKYRNRLVFVEDFTVINNKLTTDIFDKGRENIFTAEIEGQLLKNIRLNLTHRYLFSDWQNPDISFTPMVSRHKSKVGLEYTYKNIQCAIEANIYNRRMVYPSFINLPSGHEIDFKSQWRINEQFKWYANIYNLTSRHNIAMFDYPKAPLEFLSGLSLRF